MTIDIYPTLFAGIRRKYLKLPEGQSFHLRVQPEGGTEHQRFCRGGFLIYSTAEHHVTIKHYYQLLSHYHTQLNHYISYRYQVSAGVGLYSHRRNLGPSGPRTSISSGGYIPPNIMKSCLLPRMSEYKK